MTKEALEEANKIVLEIARKEQDLEKTTSGRLAVHQRTPGGGGVNYLYYVRPEIEDVVKTVVAASLEQDIAALKARLEKL